MSTMIREIQLVGDRFESFSGVDPGNRIEGLSKLNVFIGPNNSGKSRLLRAIFIEHQLRYSSDAEIFEELRRNIQVIRKILDDAIEKLPSLPTQHAVAIELIKDLRCPFEVPQGRSADQNFVSLQERLRTKRRRVESLVADVTALQDPLDSVLRLMAQLDHWEHTNPDWRRIYIPTLRGLRPVVADQDSYRHRTMRDFDMDGNVGVLTTEMQQLEIDRVVTGLTFYSSIRRFLLGTLDQRKAIREYEEFLSNGFFDGEEVTLIPREGEDVLYVKVGNEKEQPIYHLGDGIQQVIIQTWPLVLHQDKHLILCIEEPELYLHPGYQRLLIEQFLGTPNGEGSRQVFVATHSQQFLDMTLDHQNISVYRLSKSEPKEHAGDGEWTPSFQVTLRSGHDRNILQALGIRNSSVLLANCTIWVEGITDRMYIRHFLKLWRKSQSETERLFQEDIHYAFVEYSGNNITHWSFLDESGDGMNAERLCGDVFLIADKDSGKEGRHKALKKCLGDRACILECREIENILTPEVICAVVEEYEGQEVKFKNFKQATYVGKKLGTFIESSVLAKGYEAVRKGGYAATSGTIKSKLRFAEYAIEAMESFDELSPAARELTRKVVEFIREKNRD